MKRRTLSIAAVALSAALALAGVAGPAQAAAAAAAKDYWTRMEIVFPHSGAAPYVTHDRTVWPNVRQQAWTSQARGAWHLTQIVRPGWNEIYRIRTGDDYTQCLSYQVLPSAYRIVTATCANTNSQYWQLQQGVAFVRLANVANGFCLAAGDTLDMLFLQECAGNSQVWMTFHP